jgi:hypothetical protein
MTEPQMLVLSTEDKRSPLWGRLMARCERRLADLRIQNEGDKSEVETATLRGRIAEVKALLALDKELPEMETPPL